MKILTAFILFKFVDLFLTSFKFFAGDKVAIDAYADTEMTVFKHIHLLDFAFHTKKSSGSLISAMKRGEGAFWNLHFSTHYRIIDVLVRFLVMIFFFSQIDIRILFIAIATFILGVSIAILFVLLNVRFRRDLNKQEDKISGVIVDNMINFETVKLFAKEGWEQGRLKKIFADWKKAVWKYVYTFRGLDAGMGTMVNASTFFILLYSIILTILLQT